MNGSRRTIRIAVPGTPSRTGNWVTAERWADILRQLGHEVVVTGEDEAYEEAGLHGEPAEVLVALHAHKTFASIDRFHRQYPGRPLVVALTGTDLYRDVQRSENARKALRWAHRLVVLQPRALEDLGTELRHKARLIRQSSDAPEPEPGPGPETRSEEAFDVCVVGHLREVKDPLRAAKAARLVPPESRLRVLHAGAALSDELERSARREMQENPRYRWLDQLPREDTLRLMARCRVLVHTSRLEGGANAMSEAFVTGLPVVSSRVAGSVGMLGEDHPAFFEVGDTEELARLLRRCETDAELLAELGRRSRELSALYSREREVAAWASLLGELVGPAGSVS